MTFAQNMDTAPPEYSNWLTPPEFTENNVGEVWIYNTEDKTGVWLSWIYNYAFDIYTAHDPKEVHDPVALIPTNSYFVRENVPAPVEEPVNFSQKMSEAPPPSTTTGWPHPIFWQTTSPVSGSTTGRIKPVCG